ncbi:MAG: ADP-heptose--LPS heptosyltransferase [Verrucomicrobia bacterium]|nr:ADP-heptose--LPS heptosyltransferase [Verrucomicrobiota bacterium]
MEKWIFENFQSPGDIVMLTAAVRDLLRCYPHRFVTDVRTSYPELWENNPYLTPLQASAPDVRVLQCHYPLIHQSNDAACHFLHGFIEYLNEQLGLRIKPTAFKGDIHLSAREKALPSKVARLIGCEVPYWIIVAGGKYDFTIKWWHFRRWQAVVDHFRGKILFVQVGEQGHYHPPLDGVLDLRGKTTLRELVHLIYHAQGVLCPVTLHMHLAAAIETKPGAPLSRSCVVIAGGRESPHWEAYPHHQFIHSVGALRCCAAGGCWRSRTVPLGDGDEKDQPDRLCVDVVRGLPRCMDMITPEDVIRRFAGYFEGGVAAFLAKKQARQIRPWLREAPKLTASRTSCHSTSSCAAH